MKNKAIFLMGPTACGKTDLAVNLAKILPVEIVNVDSAQIYKGMDIGTNKPSKEELAKVPHHLIDIRLPHQSYSAFNFCQDAKQVLEEICNRGNLPLLVGGTMFYFYVLRFGLDSIQGLDGWNINYFALAMRDRKILHKIIEDRFYKMVEQGLEQEVAGLLADGVDMGTTAMRCVGYRQIGEYLCGRDTREEACKKAVFATRQLAKRQYTWLRKWQRVVDLVWLDSENGEQNNIDKLVSTFASPNI